MKGAACLRSERLTVETPAPPASGILPPGLREVLAKPQGVVLNGHSPCGCIGHSIVLAHVVSMADLQGVPGLLPGGPQYHRRHLDYQAVSFAAVLTSGLAAAFS